MKKLFIAAMLTSSLYSCDGINKNNVKGTYKYVGKHNSIYLTDKLEFTTTKFMMPAFGGEVATDYTVEDGYVYASMQGGGGPQLRFKIVSADTLSSDGMGFEGIYVRVQQ